MLGISHRTEHRRGVQLYGTWQRAGRAPLLSHNPQTAVRTLKYTVAACVHVYSTPTRRYAQTPLHLTISDLHTQLTHNYE